MPELPEVEIYSRYFSRHGLHHKIAAVRVLDERILGDIRPERLARTLRGRSFKEVRRHGKHLFAHAGPAWLHLHFGMTGDLTAYRGDEPRFARVIFDFANGNHLAFEDMRLFGVVDLTVDPDQFIAEHRLGPDPLAPAFRQTDFRRLLERRKGAIKSLLMSQEIIAGIGNLYADEILFQTSIHPRRTVDRVRPEEVRAIFNAMRRILRDAIARHEAGKDVPGTYLMSHREEGEICPRCRGTIVRSIVFGRTTYHCAGHQGA
jgi:formamidopyrimidine-DNA glycosylase